MNIDGFVGKELRPCPFCGSTKLWLMANGHELYVRCDNCDARGPQYKDGDKAMEYWDFRAGRIFPT